MGACLCVLKRRRSRRGQAWGANVISARLLNWSNWERDRQQHKNCTALCQTNCFDRQLSPFSPSLSLSLTIPLSHKHTRASDALRPSSSPPSPPSAFSSAEYSWGRWVGGGALFSLQSLPPPPHTPAKTFPPEALKNAPVSRKVPDPSPWPDPATKRRKSSRSFVACEQNLTLLAHSASRRDLDSDRPAASGAAER